MFILATGLTSKVDRVSTTKKLLASNQKRNQYSYLQDKFSKSAQPGFGSDLDPAAAAKQPEIVEPPKRHGYIGKSLQLEVPEVYGYIKPEEGGYMFTPERRRMNFSSYDLRDILNMHGTKLKPADPRPLQWLLLTLGLYDGEFYMNRNIAQAYGVADSTVGHGIHAAFEEVMSLKGLPAEDPIQTDKRKALPHLFAGEFKPKINKALLREQKRLLQAEKKQKGQQSAVEPGAVPGMTKRETSEQIQIIAEQVYADPHNVSLKAELARLCLPTIKLYQSSGVSFVKHCLGKDLPAGISTGTIEDMVHDEIMSRYDKSVQKYDPAPRVSRKYPDRPPKQMKFRNWLVNQMQLGTLDVLKSIKRMTKSRGYQHSLSSYAFRDDHTTDQRLLVSDTLGEADTGQSRSDLTDLYESLTKGFSRQEKIIFSLRTGIYGKEKWSHENIAKGLNRQKSLDTDHSEPNDTVYETAETVATQEAEAFKRMGLNPEALPDRDRLQDAFDEALIAEKDPLTLREQIIIAFHHQLNLATFNMREIGEALHRSESRISQQLSQMNERALEKVRNSPGLWPMADQFLEAASHETLEASA